MSATPRLHVAPDLATGGSIHIEDDQAHYIARVMRLAPGNPIRLFNGRDGEFEASVASVGKRDVQLAIGSQSRPQKAAPDLWLLFAPLKKGPTDLLVEKAVELGVSELRPVLTRRTQADSVRTDRFLRIATEAAEQTERLDIPAIHDACSLDDALKGWSEDRILYFADEAGDSGGKPWGGDTGRAPPMLDVLRQQPRQPAAILTGPEGGFDPAERQRLRALPFVRPVGLGPRILRAETAAIAALTLWQAAHGDWGSNP